MGCSIVIMPVESFLYRKGNKLVCYNCIYTRDFAKLLGKKKKGIILQLVMIVNEE